MMPNELAIAGGYVAAAALRYPYYHTDVGIHFVDPNSPSSHTYKSRLIDALLDVRYAPIATKFRITAK
jgi:hypothetical protein